MRWGILPRGTGMAPDGKLVTLGLPLGISFVTFTLIAYVVDVSTGTYPMRPSPRWLLGYTLFFPHLIAGPILRPHELIPQLQGQMAIRSRKYFSRFIPGTMRGASASWREKFRRRSSLS
jgi:alginate O-acetyltransferase complex protein AlgI